MFSTIRTASKRPSSDVVSSPTKLNYRAVGDDWNVCDATDSSSKESSSYTDSLWQAALRPNQDLRQVNISHDSGTMTLLHGDSTAPLELRPISSKATPKTPAKHHSSADGLIETAKAFIPVAVEIGVVVAAANYLN